MRPTALAAALLASCALLATAQAESEVERGGYLLRAAGCAACHTDAEGGGAFLAGGRAFETPSGVFYAPNITPHRERGIGGWSAEQFVSALRRGVGPGARHYYPVFPYTTYARMRREDALAIWAYLGSIEPADAVNRRHEIAWWLRPRVANWFWKRLYLDEGALEPDPSRSASWNRGAYLVNALAHCAECHSPRDALGGIDAELRFSGTPDSPEGAVPNITPDEDTGIGGWDADEIAEYLSSGFDPDYDVAGGVMAEVIDEGTSHLDEADLAAIAEYIASLPAIRTESAED